MRKSKLLVILNKTSIEIREMRISIFYNKNLITQRLHNKKA